ncbi:MAG TPA: Tol-Pal system beta propeller repeat protein TolB, partial [candidate division Zixibacteria bacterium]|nr:Tol-Pal system beta propeller repeat protein TolB [candidate division Zixibacteria bacterium]
SFPTILAAALLSFASSARSQSGESVRQIMFDTIQARAVEPLKVGVDQMKYIGIQYITAEDSSLMLHATAVVQRDIDFYADFDLVPLDTFYLRVYEITEVDLLGWERLGAERLVRLEAEFPGSNIRIYWRLYDVTHNQEIAKGQVEYHRAYWRELSHDVANEVVYRLTGDPGIFRTKIAYVKQLGKDLKEIFIADYDGANERQLTKTGSICLSPAFTPDGREIYFTSFLGGKADLYKVGVDDGKVVKIAAYEGINSAPAVAPDGRKIACVLSLDGDAEIYTLDIGGRIMSRLTRLRSIESAPSWSPDGRRIVFSSDRTGQPQLYVMNDDGLNERRLTFRGSYNDSPVWAPQGDRVVFVTRTDAGFNIASVDVGGSEYHMLTNLGNNENPHFAPDGKHVIFTSSRLGGTDLYTMDAGGRNQRRLTQTKNVSNPAWGPFPRR